MADKITTENTLNLIGKFVDNDTRTFAVDDPKDGLTKEEINAVAATLKSNKVFIGDKAGADFKEFTDAEVIKKKNIKLDLTIRN